MKIRVDWIIPEDKGSMDLSPEDLEMSEEEWEELPYDEQQHRLEDYLFNTIGDAIPLVQDFISIDDQDRKTEAWNTEVDRFWL